MLGAAGGVGDDGEWSPKSVQQAPGKRGERPPSYNTGRAAMNKNLESTLPGFMPKSTWFIFGVLVMAGLYFYNLMLY